MLGYVSIEKFQGFKEGDAIVVVGMGSDGWMYQFFGEEGKWKRISSAFPHDIMLPGSEAHSFKTVTMTTEDVKMEEAPVEAPAEASPEPEAPAPEAAA